MKYLVFDELSREEWDKQVESRPLHREERKKGNLPKLVLGHHVLHGDPPKMTKSIRLVQIYETDDPNQLTDAEAVYMATNLETRKRWIIPITPAMKLVEAYEKLKK
jgi:hypothetical protein